MSLQPQAGAPAGAELSLVARLRGEIESAHKARALHLRPVSPTFVQLLQQLSTEKVRLAATCGELVRQQHKKFWLVFSLESA